MKSSGRYNTKPVEFSEIITTTDRAIKILVTKTGRTAWVPRSEAQFFPGRVWLPDWLAEKILKGDLHA